MIKLESAHIEEVRGIRKLDLTFRREKFAISGPNGAGKSGVIDPIEFGLTGHIGRLTGRGTERLSVSEHGPHVDKTKFPDAAFVELKVFLPEVGKSGTITRKVSSPKKQKSRLYHMGDRENPANSPTELDAAEILWSTLIGNSPRN